MKNAPGSPEAVEMGCSCPQIENNHGLGRYLASAGKVVFWMTEGCPLHGHFYRSGTEDNRPSTRPSGANVGAKETP